MNGSHPIEVSPDGQKVTIRDLELFVGFDPTIDSDTDKDVKKYDRGKVQSIVKRTRDLMDRGQFPKLVLQHDRKGEPAPDEAVGDIIDIRMKDIHSAPGIVGDVEMSVSDFEAYVKSNKYPRRSAEIFSDGMMAQVALLGRDAPRRPLPDTRFGRKGKPAIFSRLFGKATFSATETSHAPGPNSGYIPGTDDDLDTHEMDDLRTECARLKARLAKYEREDGSPLATKETPMPDTDTAPDLNARVTELQGKLETFQRKSEAADTEIASLRTTVKAQSDLLTREKFGRELDGLEHDGYPIGDKRDAMLDRICKSPKPEDEFAFIKSLLPRNPLDVRVNLNGVSAANPGAKSPEQHQRAAEAARDRCIAEGNKHENFSRYFNEELAKA